MADKRKGFVLIWRSIWDNVLFNSDERFDRRSAWLWIITHANHTEKATTIRGETFTIQRGQLFTSVRKLAEIWGWNPETVLRFLRCLEQCNMVTKTRTSSGTVLTVINFNKYQDPSFDEEDEQNSKQNTDWNSDPESHPSQLKNDKRMKKNEKENKGVGVAAGKVIE